MKNLKNLKAEVVVKVVTKLVGPEGCQRVGKMLFDRLPEGKKAELREQGVSF
ncbi:MAG: hypothetical protein Q6356_003335 [Candidatus Wukongarchaeota archaeon]|nr:hypothetical protein [Candidatus Wukongarchaeota archaeon]